MADQPKISISMTDSAGHKHPLAPKEGSGATPDGKIVFKVDAPASLADGDSQIDVVIEANGQKITAHGKGPRVKKSGGGAGGAGGGSGGAGGVAGSGGGSGRENPRGDGWMSRLPAGAPAAGTPGAAGAPTEAYPGETAAQERMRLLRERIANRPARPTAGAAPAPPPTATAAPTPPPTAAAAPTPPPTAAAAPAPPPGAGAPGAPGAGAPGPDVIEADDDGVIP